METKGFAEFRIEGYSLRQLNLEDQGILQVLCDRCAWNENIIISSSQEKNVSLVILKELPPGKKYEDKILLGIFENSNLVGVLDMVKDFPVKGELILGLLMFDPKVTDKGLRGKIHDCIIDWAINNGFDKLRLDVAADNQASYNFWKKLGYTDTKRVNVKLGRENKEVIVMNYQL